ncbi:hypothetical protein AALB39_03930 [Lachnospiraceae bacterium 54-53]
MVQVTHFEKGKQSKYYECKNCKAKSKETKTSFYEILKRGRRKRKMPTYEIKFYRDEEEIEIDEIPEEYLNGIVQSCKSEIASRERYERVFKKMVGK